MAVQDNRPQLSSVLNALASLPASILAPFAQGDTYPLLQERLDQAIAWVEDQAASAFNGTWLPYNGVDAQLGINNPDQGATGPVNTYATLRDGTKVGLELADGNTTNQVLTRKRPVIDVAMLQVTTPILGYTRVYTSAEIKSYVRQGVLKVFTYKLAVEQALLQTIDYQAWGNLFPPLPQAVQIAYCYGFPTYDPESDANDAITGLPIDGTATSLDGGHSWFAGDQRDPELNNWLTNLREAAVCQACALFLSQSAGLSRGMVGSVSFDGYSRSVAQSPFQTEIQAFTQRRDELMGRRKRAFTMSTIV
ncbi:MAG: hypothetical protein ACRDNS_04170 [Trebonia sp.]